MKSRSFTLIELLVVIAIIGLISSIVLVNLREAREKARITAGLEFSSRIQHGLGAYAVGRWSFESIEAGNVVLDGSGYNNHGTVYGATLVSGLEQLGNALSFDGNDYVVVSDSSSFNFTSGFSLAAWVKTTEVGSGHHVIVGKRNASYLWKLEANNGNARFEALDIVPPYDEWVEGGNINNGNWHYLTGVREDDGELKIYIDGLLSKSTSYSPINMNFSSDVYIGRRADFSNEYWPGLVDEVRIYDRALTAAEIKKYYTEGLENHKNLVIK